ncbi:MAG TPA: DUF4149 domain-containing protein [Bacillota bacterium]
MTTAAGPSWTRAACGVLLAAWLGAFVHYSLLVTPVLFERFPDRAGDLVAALFPGYFRFGIVLGGLAALLAGWHWLATGWSRQRADTWRLVWALVVVVALAANAYVVEPLVAAAGPETFGRLHGLSMLLNLVAGVAALAGSWVCFAPPRSLWRG